MSADLKAIQERAEKATPGPLVAVREDEYRTYIETEDGRPLGMTFGNWEDSPDQHAQIRANAEFWAAAHSDIPALLEHIARQGAETNDLRAMLSRIEETVADYFHAPAEECVADGVEALAEAKAEAESALARQSEVVRMLTEALNHARAELQVIANIDCDCGKNYAVGNCGCHSSATWRAEEEVRTIDNAIADAALKAAAEGATK